VAQHVQILPGARFSRFWRVPRSIARHHASPNISLWGESPAVDPLGAPEAPNPEFVPADDEFLQAFGSIEIPIEEIDLGVDDPVTPIEWRSCSSMLP
jgi:hypothetical protein